MERYLEVLKIMKNNEKKEILTKDKILDGEQLKQEQELELKSLKNEVDRLREPPLEVAVIVDIIDKNKGRCAVLISSGSFLIVNAYRRVREYNLKPGTFVAVNRRTFAIMEILSMNTKKIKKYSQIFMPHKFKEKEELLEQLKDELKIFGGIRPFLQEMLVQEKLVLKNESQFTTEESLKQQLESLRAATKNLMKQPLIIGVIVEVLDEREGKCVVISSEVPLYVVNTIKKLKLNQKLESGMVVALNRRTFAIMEIISISLEKLKIMKQLL